MAKRKRVPQAQKSRSYVARDAWERNGAGIHGLRKKGRNSEKYRAIKEELEDLNEI
jgi:hypothetical protein